ncbi:MAG: hypothetical protein ACI97Y_000600, partial [Pseudomonadales bacterium]
QQGRTQRKGCDMSKAVVLLGDLGSDHEGFPPTPVIAGSPRCVD